MTPRYALVLAGAISRVYHHGSSLTPQSQHIYMGKEFPFTPVEITGAAINKHIIQANGGEASVDTFLHCWNHELESRLRAVYNTTLRADLFEDNRRVQRDFTLNSPHDKMKYRGRRNFLRSDWRQVSWAISISRAIGLLMKHCRRTSVASSASSSCYDAVIVYRPDVMLIKDLNVSEILENRAQSRNITQGKARKSVFVGKWMNGHGDLHLIMPFSAAERFGETVIDFLRRRDNARAHAWLPEIFKHLNLAVEMDDIRPGWDEEVYRKIPWAPMTCNGKEAFESYGMTDRDWQQLGRIEYSNCKAAEQSV